MTRHLQINVRIKSRKPADKRQAFHTGTQKGEQEKEILKKLFFQYPLMHRNMALKFPINCLYLKRSLLHLYKPYVM